MITTSPYDVLEVLKYGYRGQLQLSTAVTYDTTVDGTFAIDADKVYFADSIVIDGIPPNTLRVSTIFDDVTEPKLGDILIGEGQLGVNLLPSGRLEARNEIKFKLENVTGYSAYNSLPFDDIWVRQTVGVVVIDRSIVDQLYSTIGSNFMDEVF